MISTADGYKPMLASPLIWIPASVFDLNPDVDNVLHIRMRAGVRREQCQGFSASAQFCENSSEACPRTRTSSEIDSSAKNAFRFLDSLLDGVEELTE